MVEDLRAQTKLVAGAQYQQHPCFVLCSARKSSISLARVLVISGFRGKNLLRKISVFLRQYKISPWDLLDLINWYSQFC